MPPKAPRSAGRASTSIAVAILAANQNSRVSASKAVPQVGSTTALGVGAAASLAVPTISRPIQAGEPANISMAKTSWKRLTGLRPGSAMKKAYCSVPWSQRRSRRMNSTIVGGFSSQPRSSSGRTRTS